MKWLFRFILSHSIFISFCAAALSLQTLQLLLLPVNGYLLAFIFFATLAGYNAYWMISRFTFNRHDTVIEFIKQSRSSSLVFIFATAGVFICFTNLHLVMYNIITAFILLGMYAIPVMPFKQLHFTRKAGFLKTIVLAAAWAIVTTLVPLQLSIFNLGQTATLILINRFLFMLMLCIIFDKRDVAVDKIRGLQSLATGFSPLLLHCFMGLIFLGYAWSSYAMLAQQVTLPQVAALLLAGIITLLVYASSLKQKGYFFYYFLVDGLMFLSALLTGIAGAL